MRVSTRTRYGIRLMIALAGNYNKGNVLLKNVAESEDISEKYLSQIVIPLRRAGLLTGSRGMHGGYMLAKRPSKITIREIFEALEGDSFIIDCALNPNVCKRSVKCASIELWNLLSKKISEFLNEITLEDLLKIKKEKELNFIEYNI